MLSFLFYNLNKSTCTEINEPLRQQSVPLSSAVATGALLRNKKAEATETPITATITRNNSIFVWQIQRPDRLFLIVCVVNTISTCRRRASKENVYLWTFYFSPSTLYFRVPIRSRPKRSSAVLKVSRASGTIQGSICGYRTPRDSLNQLIQILPCDIMAAPLFKKKLPFHIENFRSYKIKNVSLFIVLKLKWGCLFSFSVRELVAIQLKLKMGSHVIIVFNFTSKSQALCSLAVAGENTGE